MSPITVWLICIMLSRGDIQKVFQALVHQEWLYWKDHFKEWVAHCSRDLTDPFDPAVVWDGYHWNFVRHLAQAKMWEDMKQHIDSMGETYLREQKQTLIQSVAPRLYWGKNVAV